jgi:membrane protein DedA with SNARE-associated domain/membrane-associated phospholipid phosphatase
MDSGWTQELLNWLNLHPAWGVAMVFLVSFLESLVLVGILLPGIMILFGIGTLIGLGLLDMIPVWAAASAGAFLGDTLSYALGHRFRSHLLEIWPFSRYPGLMERGTRFFHAHGAKSVLAGRFIGPLRPIIPAVGGMMGMKPSRFVAVDILACVTWAPSFLLPGMLFGASLDVASEYTGRLTVMLVIVLAVLWGTWWSIRAVYEPLAGRSARWMRHAIRWSRRHPVLGRVVGPVLGPSSGEALSVTMLGILLVLLFWGLVMLLFLSPFSQQPRMLDQSVQELALSLRNHLADPVMVAIDQLSRWPVSIFSATALLLWLIGAGRRSAALHWLVAIGGGALLHVLLSFALRAAPQVIEMAGESLRRPSAAMSLATVTLTFFAVMEASELPRKQRQWPYLLAALLLMLLALARLYLGREWLSGALMGMTMGLLWTGIVGIAYRQRAFKRFSGMTASLIFYLSFFALFAWQVQEHHGEELAALSTPTVLRELDAQAWWDTEWRYLPEDRTQLAPVASRRFNAQVAVDPAMIEALLAGGGWEPVPESDWRWIVQALNPEPDQASLPLLGRAFEGRSETLLLRKNIEPEGRLLTIRLWDSGVRLMPDGQVLYLGQLAEERLVQRFGLFSYWKASPMSNELQQPIRDMLAGLEQKWVRDDLLLVRQRPARPALSPGFQAD